MQRSRSGDRQPPPRGGGPDLGKEIMKAEHYPTMGKVMELMREGLRMMVAGDNRASGVRSTAFPSYEMRFRRSAQPARSLMRCATYGAAAFSRRT